MPLSSLLMLLKKRREAPAPGDSAVGPSVSCRTGPPSCPTGCRVGSLASRLEAAEVGTRRWMVGACRALRPSSPRRVFPTNVRSSNVDLEAVRAERVSWRAFWTDCDASLRACATVANKLAPFSRTVTDALHRMFHATKLSHNAKCQAPPIVCRLINYLPPTEPTRNQLISEFSAQVAMGM